MTNERDRRFMAAAIALGAGGLGTTWPNPAVGAILVKNGRVVGRGLTARGGRPHGETLALAMAGERARGATLYVSLEPCAHHGRTPPCADAVIAAGVDRVVAPIADPDPRVSGGGFQRLREVGIEVVTGALSREAGRAHAGYLTRVAKKRPYVTLKLAVSADDAIGRGGEAQVAVTGPVARRHVQALRTRYDAILVGRGTVEADDPQLTCRLPGLEGRSPVRIVLDAGRSLAPHQRVFDGSAPTWVFDRDYLEASPVPPPEPGGASLAGFDLHTRGRLSAEAGRQRRFSVPRAEGGLDLGAVLRRLAEEGVNRLLVEGGAHVARSFFRADLVDEAMLFRSPEKLGGKLVPALAGLPLSFVEASGRFRCIERRRFGADIMSRYERTG
jgi:diaminohydroxyphosphoribosylaminopyrimidine deaminase/5-amino-6-(5-phosphoribosylamino)uracil reductase